VGGYEFTKGQAMTHSRHAKRGDNKLRAVLFALSMVALVAAVVVIQDAFQTHQALPIIHHVIQTYGPAVKPNTGRFIAKVPQIRHKVFTLAQLHAWHVHHVVHLQFLHVHHLMHIAHEMHVNHTVGSAQTSALKYQVYKSIAIGG